MPESNHRHFPSDFSNSRRPPDFHGSRFNPDESCDFFIKKNGMTRIVLQAIFLSRPSYFQADA
jgi:hypothetical protein